MPDGFFSYVLHQMQPCCSHVDSMMNAAMLNIKSQMYQNAHSALGCRKMHWDCIVSTILAMQMCSFFHQCWLNFKGNNWCGWVQKNARQCQKHYFSNVVHMIHALNKSQKMPECIFDMFLCVVNES